MNIFRRAFIQFSRIPDDIFFRHFVSVIFTLNENNTSDSEKLRNTTLHCFICVTGFVYIFWNLRLYHVKTLHEQASGVVNMRR